MKENKVLNDKFSYMLFGASLMCLLFFFGVFFAEVPHEIYLIYSVFLMLMGLVFSWRRDKK